jgi:hypothetical protein
MTKLVRFEDWIIDKDKISTVKIKSEDGLRHDDFAQVAHSVICALECGETFEVECQSKYRALQIFDVLTSALNPELQRNPYEHYIVKRIYDTNQRIDELTAKINKLMKSYKKLKEKDNAPSKR